MERKNQRVLKVDGMKIGCIPIFPKTDSSETYAPLGMKRIGEMRMHYCMLFQTHIFIYNVSTINFCCIDYTLPYLLSSYDYQL